MRATLSLSLYLAPWPASKNREQSGRSNGPVNLPERIYGSHSISFGWKMSHSPGRSANMRIFVAIRLPDFVREELETLQRALTMGRLVPAENLHLTLSFLGEQPDEAVEEAHYALSAIRAPAFDLRLAGVGTFGSRSPQVIFTDVTRCDALNDLERRVTRSLRNAGLDFPKRRFRPHVTIARLPKSLSAVESARIRDYLVDHAAFRGSWFRVETFVMYRSILLPKAAAHEALADYDLVQN